MWWWIAEFLILLAFNIVLKTAGLDIKDPLWWWISGLCILFASFAYVEGKYKGGFYG